MDADSLEIGGSGTAGWQLSLTQTELALLTAVDMFLVSDQGNVAVNAFTKASHMQHVQGALSITVILPLVGPKLGYLKTLA